MTQQEQTRTRPAMDETQKRTGLAVRLGGALTSVRQMLALAGVGAIVLGGVVFLFLRELETAAFIVLGAGGVLLLLAAILSWRQVLHAIFGRSGRYGINTVVVLLAFTALAVIVNYALFYLINRPNPQGWLRADTTSTKQYEISPQLQNTIENFKEPIRANAFFTTNTAARRAAWQNTLDLLSEIKRRSTSQPFEYRLIDPELEPNLAAEYKITSFPSIALEGTQSRRIEVIAGPAAEQSTLPFTEGDLITGLLVVNQIKQKMVMFVSGHGERDLTNSTDLTGYGLAGDALERENYRVLEVTLQELSSAIASGDPEQQPAVVVLADATQELAANEEAALVQYARNGGSILVTIEPERIPSTVAGFLARYGIAIGNGTLVDTASYVAPNPTFLQVKRSNGQFPQHNITQGFDVIYFPGGTYIATTVDDNTVPITDTGRRYVVHDVLASTTLASWSETDPEILQFNQEADRQGPLPAAIAAEAISELTGNPQIRDGQYIVTNIVVIGDSDFASNGYFASAKNGDLLVNSVNWLARDYELISIRPKVRAFRELVLTRTERDFVRWTGWLLMPALIGAAGVWAWWARR